MCGFVMFVCVGFVICGCVCICVFVMCGCVYVCFCNMWVCACVGFVTRGVYVCLGGGFMICMCEFCNVWVFW